MLSIGWSELLIVAAVALIVVGPRDLPEMLRQVGRAAGTIRRMGNEFRAELNKVGEVSDLREIRRSVTEPMRAVSREITREFNKTDGTKVSPTGAISPSRPGTESVHAEIEQAAGLKDKPDTQAAAAPALPEKAAAADTNAKPARARKSSAKPARRPKKTAEATLAKPAAKKPARKRRPRPKSRKTAE